MMIRNRAVPAVAATVGACATESSRVMPTQTVAAHQTPYHGVRTTISIGQFDNRSDYGRGIFSDGEDRLGNQAKTILQTHLQQSGRFNVLDRTNMQAIRDAANRLTEGTDGGTWRPKGQ